MQTSVQRATADVDPSGRGLPGLFELPDGVTYLDTAAQGPRLRSVLGAGQEALAATCAPWRLEADATEANVERLRALAAGWFDGDPDGLALVPSAAHGLAIAARNVPLPRGGAVLVLDGQFPSNLLAWQQRCSEVGGRIVVAHRKPGEDWTAAVLDALQSHADIEIAALPQAHWHDGALLDLDRIAPQVHAAGAALVLDLSQSLGALPVDLARWQPDFVVAVGYKWLLGAFGLAWLWAAPRWRDTGQPIEYPWVARDAAAVWRFDADAPPPYRAGARRFDAGGVIDPMRVAMAEAGLLQLREWGADGVLAGLQRRTRALDEALDAAGLATWGTAGHAPHLAGVRPPAERLDAVATALRTAGIICTRRHGVLRIAPHLHVGVDAIARCVDVMASARP